MGRREGGREAGRVEGCVMHDTDSVYLFALSKLSRSLPPLLPSPYQQNILFCEVADGISAYGIASHRHAPEIEQGLTEATGGKEVLINFTPHLMPMSRGILESIYVKLAPGKTAADLKAHLQGVYEKEPFVHILQGGKVPETRHVRGSNNCIINVFDDRLPGRAIIISAIDNLVKVRLKGDMKGGREGGREGR